MLDDLGKPFRMLAGYIFGGNMKKPVGGGGGTSEKVAMTSPVLMTQHRNPDSGGAVTSSSGTGPGNETVAMTSPVLMTQQEGTQAGQAATKRMVGFIMKAVILTRKSQHSVLRYPDYF